MTANHVSFLDGVLMAMASPVPLVFAVETAYARHNRWTVWGMRVLAWLGFGQVVALDRSAPFGLRALLRGLAGGQVVMVFPEGQIARPGVQPLREPGVAWLAARSAAPVVPVTITGPEKSRFFGRCGRQWWPCIRVDF